MSTASAASYTLSLHDALPILSPLERIRMPLSKQRSAHSAPRAPGAPRRGAECARSEEHTSELQSHVNLVCRLLLEKTQHTSPRRAASSRNIQTPAQIDTHHRP